MPSHPDRVRRSYHSLTLLERANPATMTCEIHITIGREEIATAMSAREVRATVWRLISKGIDQAYGQT